MTSQATPVDAPPRAARRTAALVLLVTSHFLINLDTAIVEVALPSIKADLAVELTDLAWVANGYTLAFGGFLLLGGRLGDLLGRRAVFVAGLLLFAFASLVGAFAATPGLLVAARAGQGLAAAVVSPTALSLLMVTHPDRTPEERNARNRALATLGAVASAGGAAGFFLGGVLTDAFGWQSTFLAGVPVAVTVALLAPVVLPRCARPAGRGRFDVVSGLLAGGGMTLLVYVLTRAASAGWTNPRSLALGALAVVLLALFVRRQRTGEDPLLPLGIFRSRALRGANAVALLINMAIGPVIFFLSLYTQHVLGYSASASGLAILPVVLAVTVSSALAGRLLRQWSQRTVMITGLGMFAAGLLWLGQLSGGAYWSELLGPECLVGLGGGLVFVTFTVSGTSGLDERDAGSASGALTTAQKIGASCGLAILTTCAARSSGGGHQVAFLAASVPVLLAVVVAARWIPGRSREPAVTAA